MGLIFDYTWKKYRCIPGVKFPKYTYTLIKLPPSNLYLFVTFLKFNELTGLHPNQVKKEMGSIQRRCSKLSNKSEQLRGARDKVRQEEEQEEEKLAKLEARVVATTPPTKMGSSGGSGSSGNCAKVAVVKE